ncbi:MAG: putative rane protein YjgN, family [Sphingobacteriales bacterium]|nr:putative rane protein YjgN, family [Sphingobacteriales bacterium]
MSDNEEFPVKQIKFLGTGGNLFSIYIVNAILTAITLGFYYPWAKASTLKYIYEETELEGNRFRFHGTGKEMFLGYLKAVGIFAVLYGLIIWAALSKNPILTIYVMVFIYVILLFLVPVAIHGSMKYRLSRSSFRGIHFGYRGKMVDLLKKFLKGIFLTVITLGIYSPWFTISIRKYVIENIRFGDIKFRYLGKGSDYFMVIIVGYFLTIITFGIYSFWFAKDLFNYYVNNIELEQDERIIILNSTATGSGYFKLIIVNVLIIIFSLGLATPWATVRTLRFIFSNVLIIGELDLDNIKQTEKSYKDATGEDVLDMMDIGLV